MSNVNLTPAQMELFRLLGCPSFNRDAEILALRAQVAAQAAIIAEAREALGRINGELLYGTAWQVIPTGDPGIDIREVARAARDHIDAMKGGAD
jgi:hypothetical protein